MADPKIMNCSIVGQYSDDCKSQCAHYPRNNGFKFMPGNTDEYKQDHRYQRNKHGIGVIKHNLDICIAWLVDFVTYSFSNNVV
jgi:hypothetical protein